MATFYPQRAVKMIGKHCANEVAVDLRRRESHLAENHHTG
jgi:hypothetical protein